MTDFISRHIGPSEDQQTQMLNDLGLSSLDELVRKVVPDSILLRGKSNLPEPCTANGVVMKSALLESGSIPI